LTLLLLVALAVVFALPSLLDPAQQEAAPAPVAGEDAGAARGRAQKTLQEYLQLRARLELDNAAEWGEPGWSESAVHASNGDRHFAQRRFTTAEREYKQAFDRLQQLQDNRSAMLDSALERGKRALAVDDVDNAVEAFQTVLKIEPEHPDAVAGIARARNRAVVIDQMNLGRAAEANGDLETARAAYQQAVKADAGYKAAAQALERVKSAINTQAFTRAMSAALQALDAGKTTAAAEALAQAQRLRPNDRAVGDARQRLQAMRAQAGLNRVRRQVQAEVRDEDWRAAVSLYRKALAIDSSAAFARTGLGRAEQRVRLHEQFDHYLDQPSRLYSTAPLANAEKLLASASDAPPTEPRLAGKISRLRQLVSVARTPVTVTLTSDGETDVVVYHVARLGKLQAHQLDLRPGDYTVQGSRAGYRDVRKVIRVRPGRPVPPLMIRCEETI
jgi:tetratricopeptide (TPR) repeat protein